jgi:TatD DNase family protein
MFLIDSHCHLDYDPMASDIEGTLKRAQNKGVDLFLTICTDLLKIPVVTSLAESDERIFASVGIHPHEAEKVDKNIDLFKLLIEAAQHPRVVGFGETGLDYYYAHSPKDEQKKAFEAHIKAALQADLPLIVHTRDAEEDTIELLKTVGQGRVRGLIHCFTGSETLRDQALDLGFYISISGIITFQKAASLRDVVKDVPLNRLLVETDAPFLAPEPYRGKSNEPAYVVETAKKLAELKKVDFNQLCEQTSQNFLTLFSKVKLSCA